MGLVDNMLNGLRHWVNQATPMELVLVAAVAVLSVLFVMRRIMDAPPKGVKLPPRVPYTIPFVGSAIEFGTQPIKFLKDNYDKYGPVFTFHMFGRDCTYLIGSDAAATMFNSKNDDLNAEEVYGSLTIPVFGKGVVYDCDAKEFAEQKRISKVGLTIARFQEYVPMIEEETRNYIKRLDNSGQVDLFQLFAELVIMTASRCLLGEEIRAKLDESVADLYHDLDRGFTPAAWLLPGWLPLPSFRARDRAHQKMKQIFQEIIDERRRTGNTTSQNDMIATYMNNPYRNGVYMTDDQIAGMCIAILLAGQHTSSTTGSWLGFYLCVQPDLQKRVREESLRVLGEEGHVDYELLKELDTLENTLKETLRLRPPLMTMMRVVKTPQQLMGLTVPVGNYACASPTVNHIIEDAWGKECHVFNPDRFKSEQSMKDVEDNEAKRERDNEVACRGKFSYVPFGAGRHRCIGETFAYVQIKTIWSTLIRELELSRDTLPEIDYSTMIHTPKDPIVTYKRRHPVAA